MGLSGREGEFGDPEQLGRRGALLAAADVAWREHLGPLLNRQQVQQLLRVGTRQAVSELVRRRRLLALPRPDGTAVFPAYQFSATGRPYEAIRDVLRAFETAEVSPHTVASWFVTPQPVLEDRTPAEWLRGGGEVGPVLEAARRAAARLGQ